MITRGFEQEVNLTVGIRFDGKCAAMRDGHGGIASSRLELTSDAELDQHSFRCSAGFQCRGGLGASSAHVR